MIVSVPGELEDWSEESPGVYAGICRVYELLGTYRRHGVPVCPPTSPPLKSVHWSADEPKIHLRNVDPKDMTIEEAVKTSLLWVYINQSLINRITRSGPVRRLPCPEEIRAM